MVFEYGIITGVVATFGFIAMNRIMCKAGNIKPVI